MGRPKGSKSKERLDPSAIIEPRKRTNDENFNPIPKQPPPKKPKLAIKTRKNFQDSKVWNDLAGIPIDLFPLTKLPKNKVVLQRYLSLRREFPKKKTFLLVNILHSEVKEIWKAARIPTLSDKLCKMKIRELIDKFIAFKHWDSKRAFETEITKMKALLEQLLDLAPLNLRDLLQASYRLNKKWEDDWKFYLNMKDDRQMGCLDGKDAKLASKENEKQKRIVTKKVSKVKADAYSEKVSKVTTGAEYDDGLDSTDNSKDESVVFKIGQKRDKLVVLEIDPNKIVEQTAGTSDRLGLSNRQTAMMLAGVVKAGGGNLSQVKVSKSGVQRKRKKARAKKGKAIIDSFVHSKEGYVLHYDTKLVNPKGRDTEDRAAVLYSGGEHSQPYLLGIPKFESSAGKDVEVGVMKELDKYNIDIKDCLATCYDTTASNSGYKSGAHFRLERRVGHAVLELECRKHVYEVHVTHANKAVFGDTKGPQKAHYKKLKNSWSSMELDQKSMKLFDWEEFSGQSYLIEKAHQSLAWAEWHLKQSTFPRDDYKELNELIVVFLGGEVPGGFNPKRKGAMHEARFMADAIYLLSMELFASECFVDVRLTEQVHKMAVFIAVWHAPNFLKCSLAVTAPANDLSFFQDMLRLSESEDPDFARIGAQVAESVQRHTSYLKAPQVVFALFDEKSGVKERKDIASALSAIPRLDSSPSFFKPGKLAEVPLVCSKKECVGSSFCTNEDGDFYPQKTLADLVSSKSYLLFNLLHIEDLSWLDAPVGLWPCFPSFLKAREIVQKLVVVNDGAERGIFLSNENDR